MPQSQKIPFAQSIQNFSEGKIQEQNEMLGKALPCSVVSVDGSIVTVAFEILNGNLTIPQVTMPIATCEYIRIPVQVGDKGLCVPSNMRLGGISGLGINGSLAEFDSSSNLGGLVFLPVSNTNWFTVNGQYLFLYGPSGVEITTANQDCTLTLTSSGVSINLNGGTMTVTNGDVSISDNVTISKNLTVSQNVTITGNLTVTGGIIGNGGGSFVGSITSNGKDIGSTHVHSGVQTGIYNTGQPV